MREIDLSAYLLKGIFAVFAVLTSIVGYLIKGKLTDLESDNKVLAQRLTHSENAWSDNLKELTDAIHSLQLSITKIEVSHAAITSLEAKVEKLNAKVIKLETISDQAK